MNTQVTDDVRAAVKSFQLPAFQAIPDVGLFLDQTVRYINEYLYPLPDDALLTPSMITNYVKQGLIPKPEKKRYHRSQIALLICIALSKPFLSLRHIARLRKSIMESGDAGNAYEFFREELTHAMDHVFGTSQAPVPQIDALDGTKSLVSSVTMMIAYKIFINLYCQALERDDPDGHTKGTGDTGKTAQP
ncbi:MAG: DUF1836 domain-containing protein [Clostridia bacterium]|nr:DUF1836 domain-containing protein [Clostridia bacterium]